MIPNLCLLLLLLVSFIFPWVDPSWLGGILCWATGWGVWHLEVNCHSLNEIERLLCLFIFLLCLITGYCMGGCLLQAAALLFLTVLFLKLSSVRQ